MKIYSFLRYALCETKTMLIVLGTFLTIISIIDFNSMFPNVASRIALVIAIFSFTFFIAIVKTILTLNTKCDLGNGRMVTIKFGNLFNVRGVIVVPVNQFFDTIVDNNLIASNSVHGQFIKNVFGGNISELDDAIDADLKRQGISSIFTEPRLSGKKQAYPIGTIVNVEKDGQLYFLLALTQFTKENMAFCTMENYHSAMLSLIKHSNIYSQGKSVAMPLIGSSFARLNKEKQVILDHCISIIKMSSEPIIYDFQIILYKLDWGRINLQKYK